MLKRRSVIGFGVAMPSLLHGTYLTDSASDSSWNQQNRDPKSLPFAVLNLSCLTRITFCEWLQDRYLTRSLPWMPHSIVCLLQSIQSRAHRMISSKFKSCSTNLSTLKKLSSMQSFVAKRSISWWNMFWSWSSMMKPLATWVTWKVRHEQISFFCQLNMLQAFLPWARPSGRSSKSNQFGDFGHPTT